MTKSAHSTTAPAPAQPGFIDPTTLPAEYAMRVRGDCLAPAIKGGDSVLVDQRQPYAAGDLVCVFLKPECVAPGKTNVGLKRLVLNMMPGITYPYQASPDSNIMPVLIAEQDNPAMQYTIPADQILAIHRCLGLVPAGVALYDDKTGEPEYRRAVSAGWSRRELLAGAITVVPTAGLAALPALASDHPDAELLELERRMEELLPTLAERQRAHEAAHHRAMEMMPPTSTELCYCGNDARLGLPRPNFDVWNKYHVEDIQEEWRHRPDVQARFDQILALERQREQVWKDVADASGWTKAGNEETDLWDVADAITACARDMKPQTLEGAAIKARFIAFEAWHLLFQDPEPDMDWEPQVARGFVAEMMRLGGREFFMRPWEGRS